MAERQVVVRAPGKINVVLRVLGRRDDGYHELESLLLPVSLADTITVREDDRISVAMFHADGRPMLLSDPGSNLAFVALQAWLEETGGGRGASITVKKAIPMAAGLGGGSADAAGVLTALNRLWGDGLPREELARVAAGIGSDVPALLEGGPVVMRGRGEVVEAVEAATTWWVLVPQPFPVRTPDAYAWWDEEGSTARVRLDDAVSAVRDGASRDLAGWLWNDLQGQIGRAHV